MRRLGLRLFTILIAVCMLLVCLCAQLRETAGTH